MPISDTYGVWVCKPTSFTAQRGTKDKNPHGTLNFTDAPASNATPHAAINVKSRSHDSRLVYWLYKDYTHDITSRLASLPFGFRSLKNEKDHANGYALDYIRGNLMQFSQGTVLPHDLPGPNDDIIDFIDPVFQSAIRNNAKCFVYGGSWGPSGTHEVHMNQGSDGEFTASNGTWQDGGVLIYYDGKTGGVPEHWEALFLAFASQTTHTTDDGGQPLGTETFATLLPPAPVPVPPPPGSGNTPPPPPPPPSPPPRVLIRQALVNPSGPGDAEERVWLYNSTAEQVDVTGWVLRNGQGQRQILPGSGEPAALAAGQSAGYAVPDCALSNKGGTLSLLDSNGLKVDGVSWTKEQAKREGEALWFH